MTGKRLCNEAISGVTCLFFCLSSLPSFSSTSSSSSSASSSSYSTCYSSSSSASFLVSSLQVGRTHVRAIRPRFFFLLLGSRAFTPKLGRIYDAVNGTPAGKQFEVIFVSNDKEEVSARALNFLLRFLVSLQS